jgi:hypothetical protein
MPTAPPSAAFAFLPGFNMDAADHYFQTFGTVYPLAGRGNEYRKYFHMACYE